MKIEYFEGEHEFERSIETAGPDQSYPWIKPGIVYEFDGAEDEYGPGEFTPAQARAKAVALLRAADEAEGRERRSALDHVVDILEAKHNPEEFADNPSLRDEIREDALFIVALATTPEDDR